MAGTVIEGDVDVGQLSEVQQEVLQQYISVTDQSIGEAVPLLQRSQWNVQVRLCSCLDGRALTDQLANPR